MCTAPTILRALQATALFALALFAGLSPGMAAAATTYSISGSSATMKSAGSNTLSTIGYIGSYITVPAGGATVKFTVNANGSKGTTPGAHLNVVVADTKLGLRVDSTSKINYDAGTVTLPAGTYVVRVERDYDNNSSSTRSATINTLSVTTLSGGAVKFSNSNSTTNALNAANTYINNFRQGKVKLTINNLPANTPVDIHMTRNAFNFGTNIAGTNEWGYDSVVSPYNTSSWKQPYLDHLTATVPGTDVKFFNMVTTEDSGTWGFHEPGTTQPAAPDLSYVDDVLNYAKNNDMKVRLANLMWDFRNEQPQWVSTLLDAARKGDPNARANLTAAINNRINYLMNDRAGQYTEMIGLNEALLTGKFWGTYGGAGMAYFYNQLMAAAAANGNPNLKILPNEYNVLQNGRDAYGNWYSQGEIKAIRDQGGSIGAIGVQYYALPGHSPARIMQTLQNLSVQGLPIALTEFGVQKGSSASAAATYLSDTLRLMFGLPDAIDFSNWGFWQGHIWSGAPYGALWDTNWNLTPAGKVWQSLMQAWSTTLDNLTADANGLLNFTGFYGDYDVIIGDQHYDLSLVKGTSDYVINYVDPTQPIFDDLQVTGPTEIFVAANDDLEVQGVATQSLIVQVPEPSSLVLSFAALAGVALVALRRSRRAA